MDDTARTPLSLSRETTLPDEIRGLGGRWMLCDQRGIVLDIDIVAPDDPFAAMLSRSRLFQQLLERVMGSTAFGVRQSLVEIVPGLHVVLCPSLSRRVNAIGVAAIPTAEFAYGESIERLAQNASIDVAAVRSLMLSRDMPSGADIGRVAPFLRIAHRAECERDAEIAAGEATSLQISETYEEINLLYALVSSMRSADSAAQFVRVCCGELVRSLGFTWTAAATTQGVLGLPGTPELVASGTLPCDQEELSAIAAACLGNLRVEAPRVFPRGVDIGGFRLTQSALTVCPIRCERSVQGILLAGERRDRNGEVASIDLKLTDATAGHIAMYLDNARLYRDAERMFLGTLEAIINAIDAKDPYTRGHSQRVALLSRELASVVGLGETAVRQVHIAGLIHDVGKIGVPEAVLRKSGKLDEAEFSQIRRHPEIGWRILRDIPQFSEMLDGVLSHHERWDGRGYPHGLDGERIPLIARIIALADAFDAMSSNRTYRARRPRHVVLEEIRACSGSQFDPTLVWHFMRLDFAEYDRMHAEHEASANAGLTTLRRAA